jgi:hypothetical protein
MRLRSAQVFRSTERTPHSLPFDWAAKVDSPEITCLNTIIHPWSAAARLLAYPPTAPTVALIPPRRGAKDEIEAVDRPISRLAN